MAALHRGWAADLHHYWFHVLTPDDWYRGGPHVDAALQQRFGRWVEPLSARPAQEFFGSPRMALAAILLFDQLPRNLYRDSRAAFSHDGLALSLAVQAIARGWHHALDRHERQFLGMPLMHGEDRAVQNASLAYFTRFAPSSRAFAKSHRDVVLRFGRFPHRNDVLDRRSTAAEKRAVASGLAW